MPFNSAARADRANPAGTVFVINKMAILDCITKETEHREALQVPVDIWENRQKILRTLGEETGLDVVIANANGIQGNNKTLREVISGHLCSGGEPEEGKWADRIDIVLKGFKAGIKYSRHKEKFYRYIYRGEKDNAQKYHDKLAEAEIVMIEDSRETHLQGGNVGYIINNAVNGNDDPTQMSGEDGFRRYCSEMMKAHKNREKLIECIANVRPTRLRPTQSVVAE